MNDVIVSVRMPIGLSTALRQLAVSNHFMDVSEAVRSILRQHYLKATSEEDLDKEGFLAKLKQAMEEINETPN